MTTIACYIAGPNAAIAADRCSHMDGVNFERGGSKIIECGEWRIAAAGAASMHRLALRECSDFTDVHALAAHLYGWWKERGALVQASMDGTVCIAVRGGEAWVIDAMGCVEPIEFYAAIGSGAQYALGWMSAVRWHGLGLEMTAGDVAARAISVAIVHNPYTEGEIDAVVTP